MAFLLQRIGSDPIELFEVGDKPIILGRDEKAYIILLDDKRVSRQHCRIEKSGSKYMLTDLKSSNGTCINGKKVIQAQLTDGDEIDIGKYTMQFVETPSEKASGVKISDSKRMVLLKGQTQIEEEDSFEDIIWEITVTYKEASQTIRMNKPDFLIGKAGNCDIELKGSGVSYHHVLAVKSSIGFIISNISNKKPVIINTLPTPLKSVYTEEFEMSVGKNNLKFVPQ